MMNRIHSNRHAIISFLAVSVLLGSLPLQAEYIEQAFDFSRSGGDRQHYFGTHNEPTATEYDNNPQNVSRFYVVGGELRATTQTSAWVVLNDTDPDSINGSPSGEDVLKGGNNLILRTRILSLTSGTPATPAIGGFLIGLNGVGNTTGDGFFLGVQNIVNGNGQLMVSTFTDGVRAGTLATSGTWAYGASGTDYFLELELSEGNYSLNIFADGDIGGGTGNDLGRLTSSDFDSATPAASLAGSLAGYERGFVGFYFEDDGAPTDGGINLGNFYFMIPEPASLSLLLLGGALTLTRRRRH
jgi:hypothetical protein